MARVVSDCEPALHDKWFYGELSKIRTENYADLSDWYKDTINNGPRRRYMPQSVWAGSANRSEWRNLIQRLPSYFASEVAYLSNLNLEIATRIFPHLDTILANHAYFEWLLYAELDYDEYRDHIVHPFKVAMISKWLLDKADQDRSKVADKLKKSKNVNRRLNDLNLSKNVFSGDDGKRIINTALWLASLYHDLGYGHHFACCLEQRIRASYDFYRGDTVGGSVAGVNPDFIKRSLIRHHLDPTAADCPIQNRNHKDYRYPPEKFNWQNQLYANLSLNHSMAGALNMLCLLQDIIDYWPDADPRLILVFELAAEAIFLHDLTCKDNHILPHLEFAFDKTPLAIILILSDELQCWGRPVIRHRRGKDEHEIISRFEPERDRLNYNWGKSLDPPVLKLDKKIQYKIKKVECNLIQQNAKTFKKHPWNEFLETKPL
jgi:hypothetical protein